MNFTFGIITDGTKDDAVNQIIDSIEKEDMSKYEILVIGPSLIERKNTIVIESPETKSHPNKPHFGWITKKKNIIAEMAKYDYIVFMHDYIVLNEGWYKGWLLHLIDNEKFEIGVNYVYTMEGPRHVDWALSPYDMWELFPEFGNDIPNRFDLQIPIEIKGLTKFQYISGGYWVSPVTGLLCRSTYKVRPL